MRPSPPVPSRVPVPLWVGALALLGVAAATATCSSDVGESVANRAVRAVAGAATDALVGIDPGVTPSAPLRDFALAGARMPRDGKADLTVAFLAFTTTAPANNADGAGTPLTGNGETDTNGAEDVFVAAVVNTERTIAGQPVPTAFVQGLAPIFRDVRCTRCHSYHYPGGWREVGHMGSMPKGSNDGCVACHQSQDVLVAGQDPATISWLAPDATQDHVPSQDFRGRTDRELFDLTMGVGDPAGHLSHDDRILWAVGHGRVPFRGQSQGGRVPMLAQHWQNLVQGWAQAGMPFSPTIDSSGIVLASRRTGANTAGNGASLHPSVAFVPNPGYDPANPTATTFGTVFVAFASDATNLTGSASPNRDVFRATFTATMDAAGVVALSYVTTTLVSANVNTGTGGNAASDFPSLSGDGNLCVYASVATDLVSAYSAGTPAGSSNVYLRTIGSGSRALVSHAQGQANTGGNGDSLAPRISDDGTQVAFESDAPNLVAQDTNGVRDVFVANLVGAPVPVRASVRSGGTEVSGGASGHASVFVEPGEVWVAFESRADFGDGGPAPGTYVHRVLGGTTTRIGGSVAASNPFLTHDGGRLVFQTTAALDTERTDANGTDDVTALDFATFRATTQQRFERATVSVIGADADGVCADLAVGPVHNADGSLATDRLYAFSTGATNLGRTETTDAIVDFAVDRSVPRVAAAFTTDVTRGVAPFTTTFTDLSNNAVEWHWDFGDGSTSTEQSPSHTFATAGTYTVTLTVLGTVGTATSTRSNFVQATATARTWSDIYASYSFASSCGSGSNGCHNGGSAVRFLMSTATNSFNNLVNVTAVNCSPLRRVLPNNSADSVLVRALAVPSTCASMGTFITRQGFQDIVDWIDHGASF